MSPFYPLRFRAASLDRKGDVRVGERERSAGDTTIQQGGFFERQTVQGKRRRRRRRKKRERIVLRRFILLTFVLKEITNALRGISCIRFSTLFWWLKLLKKVFFSSEIRRVLVLHEYSFIIKDRLSSFECLYYWFVEQYTSDHVHLTSKVV